MMVMIGPLNNPPMIGMGSPWATVVRRRDARLSASARLLSRAWMGAALAAAGAATTSVERRACGRVEDNGC